MNITLFLIILVPLAILIVGAALIMSNSMRKREVSQMKTLVTGQGLPNAQGSAEAATLIKSEQQSGREKFANMIYGQNLTEKLRTYIEQAGLDWDPARTLYLALIFAVVGFNVFWYAVPRGKPISPLGVVIGLGLPFFYIYQKRSRRLYKFEAQFPDSLEFVSRAMRSGNAFSVALEMLHKEFDPPLCDEFRRTFDEQNLGLPLEVALERLGTRVPLLDVHFFVSAVQLQKRTGGNLAALLENLAYLMRERFKLRGRIRAISAHGRISGLVLAMIPICVAILMFFTNPDYIMFFLDDPDGKIMMAVCIVLMLLGFITMKKITDLEA